MTHDKPGGGLPKTPPPPRKIKADIGKSYLFRKHAETGQYLTEVEMFSFPILRQAPLEKFECGNRNHRELIMRYEHHVVHFKTLAKKAVLDEVCSCVSLHPASICNKYVYNIKYQVLGDGQAWIQRGRASSFPWVLEVFPLC